MTTLNRRNILKIGNFCTMNTITTRFAEGVYILKAKKPLDSKMIIHTNDLPLPLAKVRPRSINIL